MNAETPAIENSKPVALNLISWLFGIAVLTIGFINTFWGNDPGFGIFLVLLSLVYSPPTNTSLKEKTGLQIPAVAKIVLAVFIVWASLGVGELFDKIALMMQDF